MTTQQIQTLNGFDPNELKDIVGAIAADTKLADMSFNVSTSWVDGPRSVSRMKTMDWGEESYERDFTLVLDEPEEVGGTNLGPNPQEALLSAVNACIMATFTELCTIEGIHLEKVEINSSGQLDLRGFFGLDANITPGYQALEWTLMVKGDASAEQFQAIYEAAIAASPNLWNLLNPVNVHSHLQVEH